MASHFKHNGNKKEHKKPPSIPEQLTLPIEQYKQPSSLPPMPCVENSLPQRQRAPEVTV
ncbi:hypothetical protein P4S72_24965 [Vibrio sp. PP-XX7]